MHDLTQQFVDALGELHESRDVDPLVGLFSNGAALEKAGVPHTAHGRDGARAFWEQYRDVFDKISVTYRNTISDDGISVLEWRSEGTLRDGTSFRYDGVSILQCGGNEIDGFRTYYDTAAFLASERKAALQR